MFYILPFSGSLLVGTTDTAFSEDPDAAEPTGEDVAYLRESAEEVFPASSPFRSAPLFSYAGVRPLLRGRETEESRVPRKHGIFREGPGARLLRAAGGPGPWGGGGRGRSPAPRESTASSGRGPAGGS